MNNILSKITKYRPCKKIIKDRLYKSTKVRPLMDSSFRIVFSIFFNLNF